MSYLQSELFGWTGNATVILVSVAAIFLIFLTASASIGVRRLHDLEKPWWWFLPYYGLPLLFGTDPIPVGNEYLQLALTAASAAFLVWALIELGLFRGTAGPNRYGPDPLGLDPLAE